MQQLLFMIPLFNCNIMYLSRMEKKQEPKLQGVSFQESDDNDSEDSDLFQDLEEGIQQFKLSVKSNNDTKTDKETFALIYKELKNQNDKNTVTISQLKDNLMETQTRYKDVSTSLDTVQKQYALLSNQLKVKQTEINQLKEYGLSINTENDQLKNKNQKLQQIVELLKKQNREGSTKIQIAQERAMVQKQANKHYYQTFKRYLELTYGNLTECKQDKLFALLEQQNKFILNITRKISQIHGQLAPQSKNTAATKGKKLDRLDLNEIFQKLQKIQGYVYKIQSQVTAHHEYIIKLQKQIQSQRYTSNSGGIKSWFDPVLKFCKLDDSAQQISSIEKNINKPIKLQQKKELSAQKMKPQKRYKNEPQ